MKNLVFSQSKDSMCSTYQASLASLIDIDSSLPEVSIDDSLPLDSVVDVNNLIHLHLPSAEDVDAIYHQPIDDSLYLGPVNSANSPFFEGMETELFA